MHNHDGTPTCEKKLPSEAELALSSCPRLPFRIGSSLAQLTRQVGPCGEVQYYKFLSVPKSLPVLTLCLLQSLQPFPHCVWFPGAQASSSTKHWRTISGFPELYWEKLSSSVDLVEKYRGILRH